jgi:hypothetical protein
MSATTTADADLAAIRSDLSNLKGDVASLIEHFTGEVGSDVQDVSNQITDGVRRVSENAAANGERTVRQSAFGSNGDRFSRLASRWELVTSAPGPSRGEAVFRCAPIHQTRARLVPVQDPFADTSRGVDHRLWFIESRGAPKWAKRELSDL